MAFFVGALVCGVMTPAIRRIGVAARLVDRPVPGLKIHAEPVPFVGGVAVVAATLASVAVTRSRGIGAAAAVLSAALLVGLLDDARPLPAIGRVAGLAVVGVIAGLSLSASPSPLALGGAVVLVLACANAANLVDGQDGLLAGVGAIGAAGVWGTLAGTRFDTAPAAALAGALVVFLVWNRPPARIFLGNGGAYAIGAGLAWLAAAAVETRGVRGLVAAGMCLAPLAFELTYTIGRRLLRRQRLAEGDRLHSYDLLANAVGRQRSTLVAYAAATPCAALGVITARLPMPWAIGLGGLIAATASAGCVALWFAPGSPLRRVQR